MPVLKNIVKILPILILLTATFSSKAQTKYFSTFEDLMHWATSQSIQLKNGALELSQAKKEKLVTILNLIDPTGDVTFSHLNNTQLPINLIPSEVLGGQPGTFEQVQFGVQYNTVFNANIDLKIINPAGWQSLKMAKLNINLAQINNKLNLKELYEKTAVVFYEIVTLQNQKKSTEQNQKAAEELYEITKKKYTAGLVSKQNLNESEINKKKIEEQIIQIQFLIQQQYIGLKMLCDVPEGIDILIEKRSIMSFNKTEEPTNQLALRNAILMEKIGLRNLKIAKYSFLPTLSAFASASQQQFNTNSRIIDQNINWIPSSYIGLRLKLSIPSASLISRYNKTKNEYNILRNNSEQQRIQSDLKNKQMLIDYEKAKSQTESFQQIYNLRKETYEKNLSNYEAGILGLEETLKSFTEMVNSQYNLISSENTTEMYLTKININNKIN